MKFTCNKEELVKGINIVIRAAYGKYQKSILECIHIIARDGRLTLDHVNPAGIRVCLKKQAGENRGSGRAGADGHSGADFLRYRLQVPGGGNLL